VRAFQVPHLPNANAGGPMPAGQCRRANAGGPTPAGVAFSTASKASTTSHFGCAALKQSRR
jgi:hypothetical protein